MDWDTEPASEQQLALLRNSGYVVTHPLTRTEAARLIRESRRNPVRQPVLAGVQTGPIGGPPAPAHSFAPPSAAMAGELSETTRMKAHGLRAASEKARSALAANPVAPNVRADAAAATAERQLFWLETCRDVKEMQIGSVQVLEFYQRFGCRFFAPTREQVQEVLDALDAALPLWDRDHPELFYQTLELNFPQLLRRTF